MKVSQRNSKFKTPLFESLEGPSCASIFCQGPGFRKSWMEGSLITQDWSLSELSVQAVLAVMSIGNATSLVLFGWLAEACSQSVRIIYLFIYLFNTGLLMCGFVVTTNRTQGQVRQSNGHEKPPSPYFRSCPLHARFQESLTQNQWNVNLCPTIPMVCTNESDNCSKFLMLLFWGVLA